MRHAEEHPEQPEQPEEPQKGTREARQTGREGDPRTSQALETARAWLSEADGMLIAAGAGMSVPSSLPDFRALEGFWRTYPALQKQRLTFQDLANPIGFEEFPMLAWGFYGHRLALYREAEPHPGFQILRKWAKRMAHQAFVFTSNVDGQFQKAGFSPDCVAECYGSIHALQCTKPCSNDVWPADDFHPIVNETSLFLENGMPKCPHCGRVARPNILMFGDLRWIDKVAERQRSRMARWLSEPKRLVVVEIGASATVLPVRRLGEKYGPRLIRINALDAAVDPARGVALKGDPLDMLRLLDEGPGTR